MLLFLESFLFLIHKQKKNCSGCSQQRHFYLTVHRLQFKMETFMDLFSVVGRRPCLPMMVCYSSHDELDAVSSTVTTVPYISLAPLGAPLCIYYAQSEA